MTALRLITIPFSHFCEKARWALEHAGIAFVEEPHLPWFHRPACRRVGAGRTVPVLVTGDDRRAGATGAVFAESTAILQFCDRHCDERDRLYPVPTEADVITLEDLFDGQFGPHTRRLAFFHGLLDRDYSMRIAGPAPRLERAALAAGFPLVRRALRRMMRIDAAGAARSLAKVEVIFAAMDARLGDGRPYLAGERFTAADLTFAALGAPILLPPEHPRLPAAAAPAGLVALAARLAATRSGAHILKMYREHRVGISR